MKAIVIPEVGGTWAVREVPTPVPGPGELLVRVLASGVCWNDVLAGGGILPFPSTDPAIPGHEPVGEVVEVGPGVTSRSVGDVVGTTWIRGTCGECDYCALGAPLSARAAFLCAAPVSTGFTVQGGQAEYFVVRAEETVRVPAGVTPEQAVPVLCAGYTALSALRAAQALPHERVAVLGIGALGHLAVQYARAAGHDTVAITSSPDKRDIAVELGAGTVVADGAGLFAAGGADVVLATGRSYAAAADAMAGLRPGGRLVLAGIDTAGAFTLPPQLPFFGLGQHIVGATHGGTPILRDALAQVASGAVRPLVEVFEPERIAEAVEKVEKGEVRFRAVVRY
ncbi:alcohol dehydrogenase catalytic domain-containing protein [Streptomyces sp. NBC_01754]|uniref:alcohol dehydrogenase catalytic domain-containing protein n=1 Tax=Streptomyces sp. NBC_01754 TaxID=2975930 RepID=UPI002DDC6EB9|nr:alcohol dehydrogenase catalytic domain-containing protein [Streptomyces sp. NBC_01754]WSC90922.1 alcohol dehydrogenase catalytic domain-containing protein [Streptomyces sp. NBC_01754]WSC96584.1 alcohol dehydrogenase catalytic domain-containing protein [Streptomyces sp. NBC_01754]